MSHRTADIVLCSPPYSLSENFGMLDFAGQYGPPLNLLCLASSLQTAGFGVEIVDLSNDARGLESGVERILARDPEYVGVPVHFTFLADKSLALVSALKRAKPSVKIIAGGVHFTALPEATMREHPGIDVGIMGEADETLVEVLCRLRKGQSLSGVRGVVFRKGGELVRTERRPLIEDIDRLPLPAFDKIDLSQYETALYKEKKDIHLSITGSRGCPFACCFCDRTVLGRKVRFHSIDYLSRLVDLMVERLGVDCFDFEDENICITRSRFQDVCDLMESKHRRYGITWGCSMRADSVETGTAERLYSAGCRNVVFGIESGSQRMLDVYNKQLNIEELPAKCSMIVDAGITLTGSFILGGPEEDVESIAETIRLIRKIDLHFMYLWYFCAYPGSAVYEGIHEKGELLGGYSNRSGHHISFLPHTLTRQQLEDGYRRIYRAFYSKPTVVLRTIRGAGLAGMPALFRKGMKYLHRFMLSS